MTRSASNLINTPVNGMLFRMAAPISLGMLSTFLFQIVDTWFVGKLGSDELAALAFSSTVYFLFISLFIGFSVGVSSAIARVTGAGESGHSRLHTMTALFLVLGLSIGLSGAARAFIAPMFTVLGAAPEIIPLINDYMSILYVGFPFLMLGIVGSGAVRATGVVGRTEIVFGIAGVINLVFDWVLIFGIGPFPELGLAGAAVATVLSFIFIFFGTAAILVKCGLLGLCSIKGASKAMHEILQAALPTIGVQMLIPVTGMFTTFLVAGHGSKAVAAFGIAGRIEALALIGIFAVSSAVTPFIAQNFGAGKHDRIDQAIIFAGKSSIYLGFGLFVTLAVFGPWIARIFSGDPDVVSFVGLYFRIVAVSYGFQGILNVTAAIFNGLQMQGISLRIMLAKTFAITFPLLLIASFFGIPAILGALALGNALSGIYASVEMRQSARKWNRPIADASPWRDIRADLASIFRWRSE